MKRMLFAVLLCTLLLGCGQAAPPRESRLTPTKETESDNLRCYPLDGADCRFFVLGDDLFLLRPGENTSQLLLCQGRGLVIAAQAEIPKGSLLTSTGGCICCYDPQTHRALLYTPELSSLGSFLLPDCQGAPQPGSQGLIYYTTDHALKELDTRSGLHRIIRQEEGLTLTGILENQSLLICAKDGESLFIHLEDGSLSYTSPPITAIAESENRELLCAQCGDWDCLYLGQTMLPLPLGWRFLCFLSNKNAALVQREDASLAIYDLSTCKSLAELPWSEEQEISGSWAAQTGRIYFTSGNCLYQWEPSWQTKPEKRISITPLYTRENPDTKGLAQCRQRGAFLENQYGIKLLLEQNDLPATPAGVTLETEYIPFAITNTLAGIESALSRLPSGFVRQLFSGCGRVYLIPARQILLDGEAMPGLQFFSGRDCFLVIAASNDIRRGVTQAISPLMERQILMKSDALDRWDSWNPPGFSYGDTTWDETAFASPGGMTSAANDRMELFYAAMEPGNRTLFLSARLQNKLRALCQGLRQAFPLAEDTKRPWEQYLWKQQ